MGRLVITGGLVLTPTDVRLADLTIAADKIESLGQCRQAQHAQQLDAAGCYVTPGLFDLQVNGGPPCNFWGSLDYQQISDLAQLLSKAGVTSILPTIITGASDHLKQNIEFLTRQAGAGSMSLHGRLPVRMPGIHLEGPCLSPKRPGVHPPEHLAALDVSVVEKLVTEAVKLITVAAELDPAGTAVAYLQSRGVVVSLGHSDATFAEAEEAFRRGVHLVTHLFNAMPPIHHRAPGLVTAALLNEAVSCCIICDGKHIAPEIATLVVRQKGAAKTILVTDMAQVGTTGGGLVGSSITLDAAVRNVVDWGVCSFQDAINMASYNPARAMGWQNEIGTLSPGAFADVVVWDRDSLAVKHVVVGGEVVI